MKVRAIAAGFIGHIRRHEGDVFSIPDEPRRALTERDPESVKKLADKSGTVPRAFSWRWMEVVPEKTPEHTTTAQEAINRKHAEITKERAASKSSGSADGGGGTSHDVI